MTDPVQHHRRENDIMTIRIDASDKKQVDAVINMFNPPKDNPYNAVIYKEKSGWGDSVVIDRCTNGGSLFKGHGFKQRIPKVGDIILTQFSKGGLKPLKVIEVAPCGNPPDMFHWKAYDFILIACQLNATVIRFLNYLGWNVRWENGGWIIPMFCIALVGGIDGKLREVHA